MHVLNFGFKKRLRENVLNPSLAIFAPFQQKYLSAGKWKAPVDGSGVDSAGSGCCVAAPSPVTSLSLIGGGGVITLLCMCLEKHLKEEGCASLGGLLSSLSPPGWWAPRCCSPWWLQHPSHPLFCLFCNKTGCFFPPPPAKIHPETLHQGLWRLHALTFGCWFVYICYSELWTSKRIKEGLLC